VSAADSESSAATAFPTDSSSNGNGSGREAKQEEEVDAEVAPAVPDFAVYVGFTQELHRVSWDKGVPVPLKSECCLAE
jgi:hypothetical protein